MEQTLTEKIKIIIAVFRPLRWYRNVFMLAGAYFALKFNGLPLSASIWEILASFAALSLVASGNYGINEVADAKTDSYHPVKRERAIPSGKISKKTVIFISIALYILGFLIIYQLKNTILTFSLSLLLISGIVYNLPPLRLKDKPYADFIFEALNNPIRLLVGWYAVVPVIVPASLVFSFWFFGIFLMAAKRFAEIRFIGNGENAGFYRKSLKYYTEEKLLFAMIGAISAFMFMFGVLAVKYQIDFVIALPLVIVFVIWFFNLAYKNDSIIKDPERIFENKPFLAYLLILLAALLVLMQYPLRFFDFLTR